MHYLYASMQTTKKAKVASKLHPSDYVNSETGKNMASEASETISITLSESKGTFIINSDNYVIFDTGAMAYLSRELNRSDVSKIYEMSAMLKGDCSIICQDNNQPHSTETLLVTLDIEKSKFYAFIRKLVNKNILSYSVCAPSGYVQKIYTLNPYIARKRKTINCYLQTMFRDITKPVPPSNR